jgi:glycosyltransferase involved in cell wall biosynthesis
LEKSPGGPSSALDLTLPPVYLRTDLWFGVKSGGSVGHIAGVLNHLDRFAGKPVFLTTDRIPTVREDLEAHVITPDVDFCGFSELPSLNFNFKFTREAQGILADRKIAFVYQRYSVNNLSGLELAGSRGVPFVLEYNGSEVWISRNWGKPLKNEALALRIEDLVLKAAQVVVVVSRPMGDELAQRGIDPAKILVNPNGVDPDKYGPEVDGSRVRAKLGLEGKQVVGFIGTFGRWHGAEVLAEAFGLLLERRPELRNQVRLLMIGDGITMPEVKAALDRHGVRDLAVLTGLVPQAEGPAHLAACDLLVNSTVPNADGTPFFGSPTKLFEYMAMGKGIVASDLDQIGEVLKHGETAWLVKPGDVEALSKGLEPLLGDPALAARLGLAARREALERYTWEKHTGRIIEKLKETLNN